MTDKEFASQTVVVTGGSRGMGREIVAAFAARGANVVIASRKIEACRELAEQVSGEHGVDALPFACNVSSWSDCDALVAAAYERFGQVDVLINNAGLSPLYPSLDKVSESLFDKVIGVNLKGPFRLASLIGTRMASGSGGVIINVSSISAIRPTPTELAYAAAKAGLNAMTEGLAHAFGPTVRTNCIQAGPFKTDIAAAWSPELVERFESTLALRRCGQPEEVVGAALYFASTASSFCTGAILRLDGGVP